MAFFEGRRERSTTNITPSRVHERV